MYLNDGMIAVLCKSGTKMIQPFNEEQLQPASYDCKLDDTLTDHKTGEKFKLEDRPFIQPGEFLLASTKEYVEIPADFICQVWGKSSNAREGLTIHTTAGWVDPGFRGNITLELNNVSSKPFDLTKIKGICQLTFAQLSQSAVKPYNGHYQDQVGATLSILHETSEELNG